MTHDQYEHDEYPLAPRKEDGAANRLRGGIPLDQFWARLDPREEIDA